jgi:hypothetical protein
MARAAVCRPSVISGDWVNKGFHLHVQDIELAVRPGHRRGMIVFRPCFSSTSQEKVDAAANVVRRRCLADPAIRAWWCDRIDQAVAHLEHYDGELADVANGRKAELSFLKRALLAYAVE